MKKNEKITVIIPAYNEEENIGEIINEIRESNKVDEIIVVDNASTDNTSKIASELGAKVVYCPNRGKGYAMEEGLKNAKNEIIIYLDADVKEYDNNIINLLVDPILNENVEFVKSTFNRIEGGKVTQLVVIPMLNIIFPNMFKFTEPLSGMIASKKSLLEKFEYEKDYGVDIGLLIDAMKSGAVIKEVNIGTIENLSHINKTSKRMQDMSSEIIKAILKRIKGKW